jgi:hypothetical protein
LSIKNESIDFSDISGGKNSAFPRHAIANNQCALTLNALHETIGTSRAPGYKGIDTTRLFSSSVRGPWTYVHDDGTETLIAVSASKVWSINTTLKTKTQIGTLTADTECYAVNAAGKLWIVNGTDFVKVEDDLSVYRVQILAPTGTSASAKAGGTLANGVYGVYVAYARKNAAGQYLYSLPYSMGNVTLGTGSNTVTFVVPASADPQVTHKVVFMTDAGGAVHYWYAEVVNATTAFDVTSAATRNGAIFMSTVSSANQILPITPSGIFSFDDKLYVWDVNDRTVYWSLKTDVNPFDMERFLAQNFRTVSHTINSVFNIDVDLCFNHLGNGISIALSGDMSSVLKHTQKSFWYLDCKTPDGKSNIVYYKGMAFGLTNDGFRFFDGENFSEDLSFHIKPDIDKIYSGISSTYLPCAIVNRRSGKRTEYRFTYRNTDYGLTSNNDQRIFNLDFFFDQNNSKKTWECWENGFCGMAIYGRTWYGVQNGSSGGQLVYEDRTRDINCFDRGGNWLTVMLKKQFYIASRTFVDDLDAIVVAGPPYSFATSSGTINGNIILFDVSNSKFPFTIVGVPATNAVLPADGYGGLALPFIMSPQYPVNSTDPVAFACRGNSLSLEISQIEDDPDFFLYKISLPRAKQIKHNLT